MRSIMYPSHHLSFCDAMEDYQEYERRFYGDIGRIRPHYNDRPNVDECITHALSFIAGRREFMGGGVVKNDK